MFGIGMPELFVIMAIALIVIGPKKLPDLARSIGRALGEFKKATGELKSSMGMDDLGEVKETFDGINRDIKDAVNVNPLESENDTGTTPSNEQYSKDPDAELSGEAVTPTPQPEYEDEPEYVDEMDEKSAEPADGQENGSGIDTSDADTSDADTSDTNGDITAKKDVGENPGGK